MPSQGAILNALVNASMVAGLQELKRGDGVSARVFWAHKRRRRLPINLEQWFEHELARLYAPSALIGLKARGREEWPAFFERARQVTIETKITPLRVLDWLRDAHAPDGFEARLDVVSEMAFACWALVLEKAARPPRTRAADYRDAAKGVAMLRPALPGILSYSEMTFDPRANEYRALLDLVGRVDFAVPPSLSRAAPRTSDRAWSAALPDLVELYRKMMVQPVSAGWSRKGPAARFLRHALNHVYSGRPRPITEGAIEQALKQERKRDAVT